MSLHDSEIPDPDARELRKFGISTGAAIAVIFGLAIPWIWGFDYPIWPWVVFAVLGSWGLLAPLSLKPVYRVWMRFGLAINKVTTPILLGIVFFLVFVPIGFVIKTFSRDPMRRKFESDAKTYRENADRNALGSLDRPY